MPAQPSSGRLVRGLGIRDAAALVVGTIIGTGIFLKAGVMSQWLAAPGLVMLTWAAAGLLSYAGALTYAELGSRFPRAGGEYVYLKEAYGELPAFLYGWMRFWIGSPGSVAAYAVGAATFLGGFVDLGAGWGRVGAALAFIAAFSGLNCLAVSFGGRLQSAMTGLKLLMIAGLVAGVFLRSETGAWANWGVAAQPGWPGWSNFGSAMLAALWAYDGWNNLPMVGGEVEKPERNIPLALGAGMAAVLAIYALANLSYFYALPFGEVMSSNSSRLPEALPVATKAAATFLGGAGVAFVSIAFVLSALGAMNGSILTGARVPYALAQDFPRGGALTAALGRLHPRTRVPVVAVLVQGAVAGALAMTGTFDQLTDYVVFSSWIFYGLCAGAVFRLRRKGAAPAFRVPGYPWVPAVFIGVSAWLLANTVYVSPRESGIGLVLIALGVPVYFRWVGRRRR